MQNIEIPCEKGLLKGIYSSPKEPKAIIVFAHGSGSSHRSFRNQMVAKTLEAKGFATLLFDLLTLHEEQTEKGGEFRFDMQLLKNRLLCGIRWAENQAPDCPIGLFGASTGAAAALFAAAETDVFAIVSRGGRPDLAEEELFKIHAPTLLIVGGNDEGIIGLNLKAKTHLPASTELAIVSNATHLFEENGALEEVARLAAQWFLRHLPSRSLAILRNRATTRGPFRAAATQLIEQLVNRIDVENPVLLVPILRSGVAMLGPFMRRFPDTPVGFLGIQRDEGTLLPRLYYQNIPPIARTLGPLFLLDPMLATGGSALKAIDVLIQQGAAPSQIHVCSLIASIPGIQTLKDLHPPTILHTIQVDPSLDDHGFIVPGLGDFGDRFFG